MNLTSHLSINSFDYYSSQHRRFSHSSETFNCIDATKIQGSTTTIEIFWVNVVERELLVMEENLNHFLCLFSLSYFRFHFFFFLLQRCQPPSVFPFAISRGTLPIKRHNLQLLINAILLYAFYRFQFDVTGIHSKYFCSHMRNNFL